MSWWTTEPLDRERWSPLVGDLLQRAVRAMESGRFPHALLLSGPRGMARELAAVEIAVMLVCAEADGPWSDSQCADRVRVGHHPDVMAVLPQGASNTIKIDDVRAVVESAPSRPYEGESRVWILDGVDAGGITKEAANAFLKVLEEPPDHVYFLLLAANSAAVLPTIRSRCQHLSLPGETAVARGLGLAAPPGLAAAALAGIDLDPISDRVRVALREAMGGESRALVRLAQWIPEGVAATEYVAAVALDEAAADPDADNGFELARLASDLLVAERQVRTVGLNRDRQLVATLMRWLRELPSR